MLEIFEVTETINISFLEIGQNQTEIFDTMESILKKQKDISLFLKNRVNILYLKKTKISKNINFFSNLRKEIQSSGVYKKVCPKSPSKKYLLIYLDNKNNQ